jgi:hypothetical protein
LKEGSRVLVDQLKLMDEKYFELREKLELNRKRSAMETEKMKKECSTLRTKFALATGKANLDTIRLPNQGHHGFSGDSAEMDGEGGWGSGHIHSSSGARPSTAPASRMKQTKSKQRAHSPSILAARMSQFRASVEEEQQLPAEERLNVVLTKIAKKDDKNNSKKWTRDGLHDLLNR